jgi:hypothetical protein
MLLLLDLALGPEPDGGVAAIPGDDLALVLVLHVVDHLRVDEVALSCETLDRQTDQVSAFP